MSTSSTVSAPPGQSGYAAFGYRDFRFFLSYRLLSGIALQMQNVAVGWYVYSVTKSALALGLSGLAVFLPAVVLALFTGHVADTYNRRLIVTFSFTLCAAAATGLFLVALFEVTTIWPIYLCAALVGVGRAFGNPASQAITPNLVSKEHFSNAVTWYSSAWQVASISGPAIGGILYILGPAVVFATSAITFAIAAACVFVIRTPMVVRAVREKISWATLSAGLTFIWSRQVIFGAIALDLVAVLFGGATALLPIIAQDVLQTGPWGLGVLRSSPAIGAICMASLLAHRPIRDHAGKRMLVAVFIYGVAIIGFGFSANLFLSMACLFVTGAADMVSVVIRHTMVQSETPDEMRGRVAAVNSIFIGASSDLGEFESGLTAWLFGTVPAIVLGGSMTCLLAAAWGMLFPALKNRDQLVEK